MVRLTITLMNNMTIFIETDADKEVRDCLDNKVSFSLIAGAGSGKTTSLITALGHIRSKHGPALHQLGQRVACITYTKRAAEVIRSKLDFDDLYEISTLHSFLWGEVGRFPQDIRDVLQEHHIPALLEKVRPDDTGRETIKARKARKKVDRLETQLAGVAEVSRFEYSDSLFSDYSTGKLNHDDVIAVAGYILKERPYFRRILGQRYPYIFVDEAQDTFGTIVEGLNLLCEDDGLPLIGYFGDPWQQIYEKRAGNFEAPPKGVEITKTENFRSTEQVVSFLNSFRNDVQQTASGPNKDVEGSVQISLVQAQELEEGSRAYTEEQLQHSLRTMDNAIQAWGWEDRSDVIRLFLVRQMIARRLGFSEINRLFKGKFSSARSEDDYDKGAHYLLKPFRELVCPLMEASNSGDLKRVVQLLKDKSPAFSIDGPNSYQSLSKMLDLAGSHLEALEDLWAASTTREILSYCNDHDLYAVPDRLSVDLRRVRRVEEYKEEDHAEEKSDWLADQYFDMGTGELQAYCDFIENNTAYSTQHGVKGEDYPNVLVVFDDVEASWNHYNYNKLLTPMVSGIPTPGQSDRSKKLAYVCFSRAQINLRILLFTKDPISAKQELVGRGYFTDNQVVLI